MSILSVWPDCDRVTGDSEVMDQDGIPARCPEVLFWEDAVAHTSYKRVLDSFRVADNSSRTVASAYASNRHNPNPID